MLCVADTAAQPQVSLQLTASLGELSIFVSGRTTEIWWPPEVCGVAYVFNHSNRCGSAVSELGVICVQPADVQRVRVRHQPLQQHTS